MTKKEKTTPRNYSNKLRQEELEKAIFRPNGASGANPLNDESDESYTIFYTMVGENGQKSKEGNFLVKEDGPATYAKKVVYGLKAKYFVKINRQGHCFNPLGIYEIGKSRSNPKLGERDFRFREVSLQVFDFYLEFLKTKNNAYLLNAQRSLF